MSTTQKNGAPSAPETRDLEAEISELKQQLVKVAAERDAYRRMVHAWAKERVTDATLKQWSEENDDGGETILDVVARAKRGN